MSRPRPSNHLLILVLTNPSPKRPLLKTPGQVLTPPGATVTINEGRAIVSLRVTNHADRPIQVGCRDHSSGVCASVRVCAASPSSFSLQIPIPPPFLAPQVGSHYHFIETNPYLAFDRRKAYGKRLNLLAGAFTCLLSFT